MSDAAADAAVTLTRDTWGRVIALLASRDGDVAGAEDALAGALERAVRTWRTAGVPANPEGWLYRVALNLRRDGWRSSAERTSVTFEPVLHDRAIGAGPDDPDALPDRRLALLTACAHPEVDPAARPLLMLSAVMGLTAREIAAVMVLPAATVSARLTRAKKRLAAQGIGFEIPGAHELPGRVDAVHEAIHATFASEWAHAAPSPREGLVGEALHLASVVARLCPDDGESHGLAALLHLSAARFPARRSPAGALVPLEAQDPRRWDEELVALGEHHLRESYRCGAPSRFAIQAAIQAVHMAGVRTGTTDWSALARLHEHLERIAPSLGGSVARAAVIAQVEGPEAGLTRLDRLGARGDAYQPQWVLRAHLLRATQRRAEARDALERAIALTTEPAERDHLASLRD